MTTRPGGDPRGRIGKDTRLCMSLAARPGDFGTRFHNFLFAELGLDYVYKAFTTTDLPAAIGGVRALGIRGCAISMPFKEEVIALVDELDASAAALRSVNTVVNDDGFLRAYNTDYLAVAQLLAAHRVPTDATVAVRGSGGMARAVVGALGDAGYGSGTVVARNEAAGRALAGEYGYSWRSDPGGLRADLVVNATPIGMAGGPEAAGLAFDAATVAAARTVFDVVALPVETPLLRLARELGREVVSGHEVLVRQGLEQFVRYTGVRPGRELVERAADQARD
ncbi:shikimate 5-dehydrogenase [Kitasatospora sp. NPDC057015]|uniref:shikimate 5-dehydrogenase n=1 Tax=Kitasatospora sp. NPDC057015 TaxID=3346001 RepID=UPI00363F1253